MLQLNSRGTSIPLALIFAALAAVVPASAQDGWTFLPPEAVGPGTDFLYAVDGTAVDDVWAVGFREPQTGDHRSLIEHFDGSSWTQVPAPDTGVADPFEALTGVAAVTPQHAVAVGSYTPVGGLSQPLAMEWKGASWELLDSPTFGSGGAFTVMDVSPSGEIWAAGFDFRVGFLARLTDSGWEIHEAPAVGFQRNRFYGLHAVSDDEIWAVGTWGDDWGEFYILIQRYDGGGNWTTFSVDTPGWIDSLTGVYASGPDDVWATGYTWDPEYGRTVPLVMHYDGASWSRIDAPTFDEGSAELRGLAATGSNDIYAAGTHATADGTPRPLVLHYDGNSWQEVALPPSDGSHEWFRGMGATPDGVVWTVGQYFDNTSTEPLAYFKGAQWETQAPIAPAAALMLHDCYPNPFNPRTTISFDLPAAGSISLTVHDLAGRIVHRLLMGDDRAPGTHSVVWNGDDESGRAVASGVYLARLATPWGNGTGKLILTK